MDLKYALKVAVGGAFLAALFKDSDITNVMFPAVGLLTTIQPELGTTVQKGWGRLAGSAIGGAIGGLVLSSFGSGSLSEFLRLSPFLGALSFILAAIACETLRLSSAYTQAGFVAFLLATGQTAVGQDPWLYALTRVTDNWIGVAIAIVITFVFREENPRQTWQRNCRSVLQDTQRAVKLLMSESAMSETETAEIRSLLARINQTVAASEKLLSGSTYGSLGRRLLRENWSDLIASQRQLGRSLGEMSLVRKGGVLTAFEQELVDLANRVFLQCEGLIYLLQAEERGAIASISLTIPENLKITEPLLSYSLSEIEQFSRFAFSLEQFIEEITHLSYLIASLGQAKENLTEDKGRSFKFLSFKPLSLPQLRHILAVGITMGFALALFRNLFVDQPEFAYLGILGVLLSIMPVFTYGSVPLGRLFLIPPLLGTTLVIFLNNTLGGSPFTVGLGLFVSTIVCYWLKIGFLSSAGAVLIVAAYFFPPQLFIPALLDILLGMLIGSVVLQLFKGGQAAQKLEQSIAIVFERMADLYNLTCQSYVSNLDSSQSIAELRQAIGGLLQKQPLLKILSDREIVNIQFNFKRQELGNFLMAQERELFGHLTVLAAITQEAKEKGHLRIPQGLLSEFQALVETTGGEFKQMSLAIANQTLPPQASSLKIVLESFEKKLSELYNQQSVDSYSLEQVILFFSFCLRLKEIAAQQLQIDERCQKV